MAKTITNIKNKEIISEKNFLHLGYGKTSKAFKITVSDLDFTCKKIKKKYYDDVKNEIKLLKLMSYEKYFPNFNKIIKQKDHYYVLYEYIDGLDLHQMINNPLFPINSKLISTIIYQVTEGLECLFSHNYIHLDIKLENILIQKTKPIKIKIIDLAFCSKINKKDNKLDGIIGTLGYCSPEIILYRRYYHNSDIWSLGVVMYALFNKYDLFDFNKYFHIITNFTNIQEYNDSNFSKFDVLSLDLLTNMLIKNPNYRYSIKDVLNHPFLKKP